jgi:hypothetical protein
MLALLLNAACLPDGADDSAALASTDISQPRHPEATYTAEEAAEAMREAVRFGVPLPSPAIATWAEMMTHGDEGCPGGRWYEGGLEVFPAQGCTASSGYWYQGVGSGASIWLDEDRNGSPDLFRQDMKTDGAMRDALGNTFYFGGAILLELVGTPETGGSYEAEILGTYGYPLSESFWMQQGTSTGSYLSGEIGADGSWTLTGSGGFTVGGLSVGMDEFTLNVACPDGPGGIIGVRDEAGYWYDLAYDESTCDSCGEVTFDGRQDLGRACADVSPAFSASFSELVTAVRQGAAHP